MMPFGLFSFLAVRAYRKTHAPRLVAQATSVGAAMDMHPSLVEMAKGVPVQVYLAWRKATFSVKPGALHSEYWTLSCLALLVYFRMCALDDGQAKRGLALPSQAARAVWQAWQTSDLNGLQAFLNKHLGQGARYVGPCPRQTDGWAPRALADAWVLGERCERIDARVHKDAHVPFVFSVDKTLRLPNGVAFSRDPFEPLGGYYQHLDKGGCPTKDICGRDILSELFLYTRPDAVTPMEAFHAQQQRRPLMSRVLSALRESMARGPAKVVPRSVPINTVKSKKGRGSRGRSDDGPSLGIGIDGAHGMARMMAAAIVNDSSSNGRGDSSSTGSSCSSGDGGAGSNGGDSA